MTDRRKAQGVRRKVVEFCHLISLGWLLDGGNNGEVQGSGRRAQGCGILSFDCSVIVAGIVI